MWDYTYGDSEVTFVLYVHASRFFAATLWVKLLIRACYCDITVLTDFLNQQISISFESVGYIIRLLEYRGKS